MDDSLASLTQLLNGELVYALGWTILHSLWQCAVIAIFLAIGLRLSKNLSSNSRYLMAYTALLLCFFISVITFHSYWEQAKAARLALTLEALGISPPETINLQSLVQQWLAGVDRFLIWIVMVWLAGCAFISLRGLVDFYTCMLLKARAKDSVPDYWLSRLQELRVHTQVAQAVNLGISQEVESPCTLGYFKPIILLPARLLGIPEEHIDIILLHELGHIRRNDYAFGLLQMLLKILFFFNPMALWMSSIIDTERENACDDIAMDVCKNPMMFSQVLQVLATMKHRVMVTAMPIAGPKMTLLSRIKRQFTQRDKVPHAIEKSVALGVLILSCITACVYAQTNSPDTESEVALAMEFRKLPAFASLSETEQASIAKHFLEEYDSKVFNTGAISKVRLQPAPGAQLLIDSFDNPLKRKITINTDMLRWLKTVSPPLQQDKVFLFKDDAGNSVIALEKLNSSEPTPSPLDAYKTASLNNKFFVKTQEPKNWKDDPADLAFKVSYQYLFVILSPKLIELTLEGADKLPQTSGNIVTDYHHRSLVSGAPYAGGERADDGSLVITYDRAAWQEKMDWMDEHKLFANSSPKRQKIPSVEQRHQDIANLMGQLDERRKKLSISEDQFETIYTCFHRHFGFEAPSLFRYNMQSSMLRDLLAADEKRLTTMEATHQARISKFSMGPKGDAFYINLLNPDFTTCDRHLN